MSEGELPEGWAEARLADGLVADLQPGFACGAHSRDTSGVPHLRPMNVTTEGRIALDDLKFILATEVDREERWIRRGDVLFNNTNSPELVGKTAYYGEKEPRAFSNHMTRVRPNGAAVDAEFLAMVLHQRWREGHFAGICNNHVSQASIGRSVLLETEVPVPPLGEQRRIVEKVEALLAEVNTARARLAKVPAILKRFRQSILSAACAGRLTEGGQSGCSWRDVELGELIESSFYGPRFGDNEYRTTGVPTIRTSDMDREGNIVLSAPPRVQISAADLERLGLRDGDLLVTRTGATIGKCAVYSDSLGPALPSAYLIRFRLKAECILPRFALLFLMSPEGQSALTGGATATAQPNVNAKTIAAISLTLPPPSEQKEIVCRVDALFKLGDAIEAHLAAATAHADKLTQAILAKAFRGELVPTEAELARQEGRDYEPASALLARIRAEREANEAAPKPSARTRRAEPKPTETAKPARRKTTGRAARPS